MKIMSICGWLNYLVRSGRPALLKTSNYINEFGVLRSIFQRYIDIIPVVLGDAWWAQAFADSN